MFVLNKLSSALIKSMPFTGSIKLSMILVVQNKIIFKEKLYLKLIKNNSTYEILLSLLMKGVLH